MESSGGGLVVLIARLIRARYPREGAEDRLDRACHGG